MVPPGEEEYLELSMHGDKNLNIQAVKLFIHSFNKDVLNACCVSGTVQGVGRKTEMKTALSSKSR